MLYVDLLDSVKSAHPRETDQEWWHVRSKEEQAFAVQQAQAEIMMRLLHGETIVLSNNQIMDSYAWMTCADVLLSDARLAAVQWTPVVFAYYDPSGSVRELSAEVLRECTINNFANTKFVLSAWPQLDERQRQDVVENIKRRGVFFEMFRGVTGIPDVYHEQARSIQHTYEYLDRWQREKGAKVIVPVGTSDSKRKPPKLIWPRVEALPQHDSEIYKQTVEEIKRVIVKDLSEQESMKALEARSRLYQALGMIDIDDDKRDRLRGYIDRFYNEKLGRSVSGGRGVYTIGDNDPETPVEEDLKRDEIADVQNTSEGVLARIVLECTPEKLSGIDTLEWDDVLDVISDPEMGMMTRKLQDVLQGYYRLNSQSHDFHRQYREWLLRSIDALEEHHEKLSKALARKIVVRSKPYRLLASVSPVIWEGAGAIIGGYVGYIQGLSHLESVALSGAGAMAVEFLKLQRENLTGVIAASVAGRVRQSLDDAVRLKSDEELLP
ncbi:hypothetical protein D6779_11710 [Candidatus Parcubacteria bacterium]|nr:MAG: hypothetical protein D6779_11710 [Candidatus Parcubacteria bacterium]